MARNDRRKRSKAKPQHIDWNAIDALKVELHDGSIVGGPLVGMYSFDLDEIAQEGSIEGQRALQDLYAFHHGEKTACDPETARFLHQQRRHFLTGATEITGEPERRFEEMTLNAVIRNALVRRDDGTVECRDPCKPTHKNSHAARATEQAMIEHVRQEVEGVQSPTSGIVTESLARGKAAQRHRSPPPPLR